MSVENADLEGIDILVPLSTLAPSPFLPHLSQGSLNPQRRDLGDTSLIGLSVQRSLTLCIVFGCESLHLFPTVAFLVMVRQSTDLGV